MIVGIVAPSLVSRTQGSFMLQTSDFADWLSRERNNRGWSQDELAEKVGVTQEYISGIERRTRNASEKLVRRIAHEFSKDSSDIKIKEILLQDALLVRFGLRQNRGVPTSAIDLTQDQKLKLWESMGARTYHGPEPHDTDFELSENPDDWPSDLREALQEALFFTRLIPPEFVKIVFQLWRDQARAHAGVAIQNKVMDAAMKEAQKQKN